MLLTKNTLIFKYLKYLKHIFLVGLYAAPTLCRLYGILGALLVHYFRHEWATKQNHLCSVSQLDSFLKSWQDWNRRRWEASDSNLSISTTLTTWPRMSQALNSKQKRRPPTCMSRKSSLFLFIFLYFTFVSPGIFLFIFDYIASCKT